ncbi:hypothetical protein [Flaviaesturariibacter aridisoli]|uniref:Lipoprotein n=1 Tax=Flaviaesturariibacter aridisoli TaxID=2545761 RepID=A0A4R4DZU4_9BACT|nr:hypothetical protein [Flaviaesturariibacter aridisoli]TCZ70479.1 hypothetical protein E0486_11015 [Flaviaesturariibacter aridisoli]
MKIVILLFQSLALLACSGNDPVATPKEADGNTAATTETLATASSDAGRGHYEGVFSNGMKETFLSFDVSKDGNEVRNLTFKGWWYCDRRLTQERGIGPQKGFAIRANKVDGVVSEPENGGASAVRFELHGTFSGNKASGTFRMNINGLGCDTYVLNWTANRK